MSTTRGNPFRGFVDMMSELDRMRRLGKSGHDPAGDDQPRMHSTAWVPAADIYALGADLVLRIELPGVRSEEIDISFADSVLTISGRRDTEPGEAATFYTREIFHGPFRRSMILPDDVDEDQLTASLADGVAEIIVRGAAALAGREPARIPITDTSAHEVPLGGRGLSGPGVTRGRSVRE